MLWLLFALSVAAEPLQSKSSEEDYFVALNLRHGGILPVPSSFTNNLDYLVSTGESITIQGQSDDGRSFIRFEFHVSGDSALIYSQIMSRLGLNPGNYRRVAQNSSQLNPAVEIFSIEEKDAFADHLMAVGNRSKQGMVVLFLFVGPRESFYKDMPNFAGMVDSYRHDPNMLLHGGRTVNFWSIGALVLTLIVNLVFIWLGFIEIARTSTAMD